MRTVHASTRTHAHAHASILTHAHAHAQASILTHAHVHSHASTLTRACSCTSAREHTDSCTPKPTRAIKRNQKITHNCDSHLMRFCVRDVYVQDASGAYKPDLLQRQEKLEHIHMCYELKFASISERFYKQQPWPHPDKVCSLSCAFSSTCTCVVSTRSRTLSNLTCRLAVLLPCATYVQACGLPSEALNS